MVERLCLGPASVKELAAPLTMSLPAVVQHLTVLEDCGLIATLKSGRVRTCRIEPEAISLAEQWLNSRRLQWGEHFDRLGDFLATEPEDPTKGDM